MILTNLDERDKISLRRIINDVITTEEKGLISFSNNEPEAQKQRIKTVREALPKTFQIVNDQQLSHFINLRKNMDVLNLSGRDDIFSLNDIWIPPSVKVINLDNCINLSEIGPTPSNVKGLKLDKTAVRDFRKLSNTVCEVSLCQMQGTIFWHSFPNRSLDNPLDILINMQGEKALCRIPDRFTIMFKETEAKSLNIYIQGWFSKPKEFIYLQEYIYTDPKLIAQKKRCYPLQKEISQYQHM